MAEKILFLLHNTLLLPGGQPAEAEARPNGGLELSTGGRHSEGGREDHCADRIRLLDRLTAILSERGGAAARRRAASAIRPSVRSSGTMPRTR